MFSSKKIFSKNDQKIQKKILVALTCSCLAASTVIALPFALFTALFTTPAQAQSRRVRYVPPSNLDAPRVSTPGITRSSGCDQSACLIALVPDLQVTTSPVPQTISERPTIYFLSPKVDSPVTFVLSEDYGLSKPSKRIYRKNFPLKNEAGVIAFKLPDDAPILEIGKTYKLRFDINDSLYSSKTVYGYMQRVLPSQKLVDQLNKTSNPIDRAVLFAQEGIWFEALQALAEAQLPVPKKAEIIDEWTALLKSANLDRVLPYSFVVQK